MNEKIVMMAIDQLFNTKIEDERAVVLLDDDFALGLRWPNAWTNGEPEIGLLTNLTKEELESGEFEESVPIVEIFSLYEYFETPNGFADNKKRMKLAHDIVKEMKVTDVAKVKKEWPVKQYRY